MKTDLSPNRLKEAIGQGRVQLGLWASLSSSYTAEVIAGAGYDWILIDTEHSPADLENVLGQLQAIEPYPTTPVVRVPWNDTVIIKRYLDVGAQSSLIPNVQTAEEANRAVANTRYPPDGVRGIAMTTRANRFGRVPDYTAHAAEQICVIVQISWLNLIGQSTCQQLGLHRKECLVTDVSKARRENVRAKVMAKAHPLILEVI